NRSTSEQFDLIAPRPSKLSGNSTTQAYYSIIWLSLTAEDHLAEVDAGHSEIDDADGEHRDERTPHKGDVGATEQHGLSELDEMRRRADRLNEILQPDRHALHRRAAAREQLRDHQHRHGEQAELAHGRGER